MTMLRLGDCGTWLSGGTPSKTRADLWSGDIPWVSAKSLHRFFIESSDLSVSEDAIGNGTRLVPEGTILFIVRGMSLKTEFRMGITTRPVAFNQDLKAICPNDGVYPQYLAYALKAATPRVLNMVDEAGHGTGRLQTDLMMNLEVRVPPLPEQRRIAEILGALDDKIELNRKMNQTLEEMAQAIFKSWFIDFDGHTEFVDSELGRIPKGWLASHLGDILQLVTDGAHTSPPSVDIGRPMASVKDLTPLGVDVNNARNISEEDFEELVRGGCQPRLGDVLLSKDGAKCLELSCEYQQPEEIVLLSSVAILRPIHSTWSAFVDLWLRLRSTKDYLREGFVGGSAIPRIVLRDVKRARLVTPPEKVMARFHELVDPIRKRQRSSDRETRTLSQLRDTLLPKLISGELRVRDAEKTISRAV